MVSVQSGLPVAGLKGVGQLIAITLVAELGDFSDFPVPNSSWLFWDWCQVNIQWKQYSSQRNNKSWKQRTETLLYEAAWSYRTPAKVGAWLIITDRTL